MATDPFLPQLLPRLIDLVKNHKGTPHEVQEDYLDLLEYYLGALALDDRHVGETYRIAQSFLRQGCKEPEALILACVGTATHVLTCEAIARPDAGREVSVQAHVRTRRARRAELARECAQAQAALLGFADAIRRTFGGGATPAKDVPPSNN